MIYTAIAAAAFAAITHLPWNPQFEAWKRTHSKAYTTFEEELEALKAFEANEMIIRQHNAKNLTWTLGHNAFSDLTWDEFKAEKLMTPQNCSATHTASGDWKKGLVEDLLPDAIDWRDEIEKITPWPVKNQVRPQPS
jgi:hypothetical protein